MKIQLWYGLGYGGEVRVMVFNATFNNISVITWQSVLLMEETGVPEENHWPVASHWQTLHIMLYRVHLAWMGFDLTTSVVIDTDCIGICKSNYHTITVAPSFMDLKSSLLSYVTCIYIPYISVIDVAYINEML